MAFTRKFLKALGIEDDKIDTIMEEHTTVTDGLKKERDGYKVEADKVPGLTKERDDALNAGKGEGGKDYKQLYDDLVASNAAEAARAGKESGYKGLLKTAKVAEKYWPMLIKANSAEIDKLEMDGDKVKGADDLVKAMQTDLATYIPKVKTSGADVDTPPGGDDDDDGDDLGDLDMDAYIAARKKM